MITEFNFTVSVIRILTFLPTLIDLFIKETENIANVSVSDEVRALG